MRNYLILMTLLLVSCEEKNIQIKYSNCQGADFNYVGKDTCGYYTIGNISMDTICIDPNKDTVVYNFLFGYTGEYRYLLNVIEKADNLEVVIKKKFIYRIPLFNNGGLIMKKIHLIYINNKQYKKGYVRVVTH